MSLFRNTNDAALAETLAKSEPGDAVEIALEPTRKRRDPPQENQPRPRATPHGPLTGTAALGIGLHLGFQNG
ncbi:MAG: hypothetical protein ACM3N0_05480 [Chloroflexota bacterium]